MLSHTIAAFCIIDDALQAMGYKDDPDLTDMQLVG
jgi:hypothetical protein